MIRSTKLPIKLRLRLLRLARLPRLGWLQVGLCCLLLISACQTATTTPVDQAAASQAQAQSLPTLALERPAIPTQLAESLPAHTEPAVIETATASVPTAIPTPAGYAYLAQSGDTLELVARRFGVQAKSVSSFETLPEQGFLPPGAILWLPQDLAPPAALRLLPDSEIVYGPSALDFDLSEILSQAGGALASHEEYLESDRWASAAEIISRVAVENSINPRQLVATLEYICGCVSGPATANLEQGFALNVLDYRYKSLYGQLWWAANQLSTGYYGWREGWLTEIALPDGSKLVPGPDSNAGSVAIQYLAAQLWAAHEQGSKLGPQTWAQLDSHPFGAAEFQQAIDPQTGLAGLHQRLFGDAWQRASTVEPLLPGGLDQVLMALPFETDQVWSFTSGPHTVWERKGAQAALDFAPASNEGGCLASPAWVTAVADGPVVRVASGLVMQDINSGKPADGLEQTGWAVLYMHIAASGRVEPGTMLHTGDRIGHPSCEGGPATGTHLHIARKYNGEWIAAAGALPFVLSGWTARAGDAPYQGSLHKGKQVVTANLYAIRSSQITRLTEPTAEAPGR